MNNHKLNKYKTNNHPSPNQELYHPIFQVGKPWPSGLERRLKKYGWFSSGLNKLVFIPLLNLHFLQGRRSRALAQVLPTLNKERNRSSHKPAFTIIEVVLVLAIAGLIFLMVFVALPALQRNQRDAQRKNDMAAFLDAYERCRVNNKGRCFNVAAGAADMGTFNMLINSGYINTSEFKDPSSGEFYRVRGTSCTIYCGDGWQNVEVGQVIVNSGGGCDKNGMYDYHLGPKSQATFVFLTRLEGGGYVCASNENL